VWYSSDGRPGKHTVHHFQSARYIINGIDSFLLSTAFIASDNDFIATIPNLEYYTLNPDHEQFKKAKII
jgi:hypothetical protein